MGLMGTAAIAGICELAPTRRPDGPAEFTIEQYARLGSAAVADAGLDGRLVDGIVTGHLGEAGTFAPSTITEYLGIGANFAEMVDLGGANAVGMVWRAAAAVELGICQAVLCVIPGSWNVPTSPLRPSPDLAEAMWFGASSNRYGSPQAEFEIPYGNLGQNAPYAQIARLYGEVYGYDERAMAKIAVDQRTNACATPDAVFHGQPITIDDVLASPLIADPLHKLEIVMPCQGGAAVLVTNAELAGRGRNRPVWVKGFGERVTHKTPTYAADLLVSPIKHAAEQAFAMSGLQRSYVDMVSIYDCYTITALMTLEDAGFCEKGKGMQFVRDRDLTFRGDFPMNTGGGQLSFGQAGSAGGMHHVCDATRQLTGRAGAAQVAGCDVAFVSGNGGIMGEQSALVLQGD